MLRLSSLVSTLFCSRYWALDLNTLTLALTDTATDNWQAKQKFDTPQQTPDKKTDTRPLPSPFSVSWVTNCNGPTLYWDIIRGGGYVEWICPCHFSPYIGTRKKEENKEKSQKKWAFICPVPRRFSVNGSAKMDTGAGPRSGCTQKSQVLRKKQRQDICRTPLAPGDPTWQKQLSGANPT